MFSGLVPLLAPWSSRSGQAYLPLVILNDWYPRSLFVVSGCTGVTLEWALQELLLREKGGGSEGQSGQYSRREPGAGRPGARAPSCALWPKRYFRKLGW